MKITICDVCNKEGILKKADRYLRVSGTSLPRVDFCNEHMAEFSNKYKGVVNVDYVKFVYSLHNVTLSDEDAKRILMVK